jgi:pyruvate ferredoxin oxidoreductase gamma subunit
LIRSSEPAERWRERLNTPARVVVLPITEPLLDRAALPHVGATCAGAAARLLGLVPPEALAAGIQTELGGLGVGVVERNLAEAMAAYEAIATQAGAAVVEGGEIAATDYDRPAWIDLKFETARVSAPAIHAALTSEAINTGLWRSLRPEIDYGLCKGCWWVCSSLCPDGAIRVEAGRPRIDYDHCKGCLVCLAVCPPHAISANPEGVTP